MPPFLPRNGRARPSLAFVLLCAFLGCLWIAGGASRADALGQVVVRAVAGLFMVLAILLGDRPLSPVRYRPVWIILAAATALVLIQLVPLPPDIWQSLPGRALFAEAAAASGQAQPWRPWSIVPGATVNATGSLLVPAATLLLITGLRDSERPWLPGVVLALIVASMLLGLLQFSGVAFENPLINETAGEVSGSFANRNHFALFLALGCLVAPAWAFLGERRAPWRGVVAVGLVLLFVLLILASGSRAGMTVGIVAVAIGLALVWRDIRNLSRHRRRWVFPATIAGILGMIGVAVLASLAADRAISVSRVISVDPGQDMRSRGLPTVLAMVREYFPMGSGFGGFDPLFRLHEPHALLKYSFFNHAHDDFLEIVLDAGLPGLLLLLGAMAWWAWAGTRAWRAGSARQHVLPKLGTAVVLLILAASVVDYPARTPMMMAVIVIAGCWLCEGGRAPVSSALPSEDHHL